MSNKTKEPQPPVELKETGFGVAQDRDGRWMAIEIKYNALTGDAKVENYYPSESKGGAVERFKILVGQSNILD